jgi:hypothetical protein
MNTKTFTKKCSILALLLLLLSQGVYAQTKEGNNWYFGASGRLTWNQTQTIINGGKTLTGLPMPLGGTSAMTNQGEGVFCMSDIDGNLLFYSDGMTIWNRNHMTMLNGSGLYGHNSSAQSGIVIPYPGQSDKYIAVSMSLNRDAPIDNHIGNRLAYTIVDMSANSGLGAVVTAEKNIVLTGANGVLGECVSAVRHSNGVDFWIVAVGKGSGANSSLNVWEVTSLGVNAACVGSYQLVANTGTNSSANGYLRFSVDGKYWAWIEFYSDSYTVSNMLHFGEFNPSTGTFPTIKRMNTGIQGYGVEFSPSKEILYITSSQNQLRSYKFADLLAASNPPTGVSDQTRSAPSTWALQLGPDGRIYGVIQSSSNMTVIDDPDNFAGATVHVLTGLMAGQGMLGLPNFLPDIFAPTPVGGTIGENQTIYGNSIPDLLESIEDASCSDGSVSEPITYLWEQSADSATWTTAPVPNNLSDYQPPALTATTYYRRSATSNTCGTEYSNVIKITVLVSASMITVTGDTNICAGEQTTLTATASSVTNPVFRWYNAPTGGTPLLTSPTFTPSPVLTTTYYVSVSESSLPESTDRKAVVVTVRPRSTPDMIKITVN